MISRRPENLRLTQRTIFRKNDVMLISKSISLTITCRRNLRAWRVAVCPGPGAE